MNVPEKSAFLSLLRAFFGCNSMDAFAADEKLCEKLYGLTVRMLEVNEHMNLTNITAPDEIILRHYVDSLSVCAFLPQGAAVLDVGCGAGFPSLPLALARPDLRITAIDSTEKKVLYVRKTAEYLGIAPKALQVKSLRAEEGGAPDGELRERFDFVVSRAVARLSVLDELALPCLRVGGKLLAMKGARAAEELAEAAGGIPRLGGGTPTLLELPLARPDGGEDEHHALVIIEKREKTPKIYPRKYAQILKKPL